MVRAAKNLMPLTLLANQSFGQTPGLYLGATFNSKTRPWDGGSHVFKLTSEKNQSSRDRSTCRRFCAVQVGKELFIETTGDQLILRTLNDAKSAFAAFYFNDSGGFFETFRRGRGCSIVQRSQGGGVHEADRGR